MEKNQRINSSIIEEVVEIRRYLHKYPELSEQEYNTCKYNCMCHCIYKCTI